LVKIEIWAKTQADILISSRKDLDNQEEDLYRLN
jgi:hypothetical protein